MRAESQKELKDLAKQIMEPVLTVAGRRLEQALEEVHETHIQPLASAASGMLAALEKANATLREVAIFLGTRGYQRAAGQLQASADECGAAAVSARALGIKES